MKVYDVDEIKELTKQKEAEKKKKDPEGNKSKENEALKEATSNTLEDQEDTSYSLEEYDKAKTKVLKYVLFKKRAKGEIRKKFNGKIDEDLLEEIIKELEENGYVNDEEYIKRFYAEYMALKDLSLCEIKYKLMLKGVPLEQIENYIFSNREELMEYEKRSARNIVRKKFPEADDHEIKFYLMKKSYNTESIKNALEFRHNNLEE